MAFNNVPVNGWPQIKDLEKLDAIAQAIENMPTFTSTDRDWMDEWEQKLPELPEDPETDGVKILKATTTSGETVKSWGDTELPPDPLTDGVKVLTATTTSGETVKSWEEPESGIVDYSTTEYNTGRKWIDGSDIYSITVDNGSDLTISSNTWTDTPLEKGNINLILGVLGTSNGGSVFPLAADKGTTYIRVNSWRNDTVAVRYVTLYYTKTA